jgi:hypothetical protein
VHEVGFHLTGLLNEVVVVTYTLPDSSGHQRLSFYRDNVDEEVVE